MNRLLVAASVALVDCQQGPKGDTGAQGPAGPPGVMGSSGQQGIPGPRGDAGETGPAGMTGAPGQVVVLVAADGGSVVVDGGVAIVAGPQGAPGQQGVQGAPGQALFIFAADGGTAVVDGGVVVVAGPQGEVGMTGGLRVMGPDGGLLGYATGTDFYSTAARCFTGVPGYSPQAVTSFARLCWTGVACTGTPMLPFMSLTVRDSAIGVNWSASAYGRCFYGGTRNSLGVMEARFYRLAQPVRRVPTNFLSCGTPVTGFPQWSCDAVSFSLGAYAVEELPSTGLVPTEFPPVDDGTILTP
ncbi:MAG: collagen-like protein [Myxococcaceae bacterium]|nr:collagen-like protein [Myxococcaceae bacterium]